MSTISSPPPVHVVSSRTVKPPPRPRERIALTYWDIVLISAHYIQAGLLLAPAPTGADVGKALADALTSGYYPIAGRFVTKCHRDDAGDVIGCSLSIDCDGQGVELLHAIVERAVVGDVVPPGVDVPKVIEAFFPLNNIINDDGHQLPLFVVQVTERTRL